MIFLDFFSFIDPTFLLCIIFHFLPQSPASILCCNLPRQFAIPWIFPCLSSLWISAYSPLPTICFLSCLLVNRLYIHRISRNRKTKLLKILKNTLLSHFIVVCMNVGMYVCVWVWVYVYSNWFVPFSLSTLKSYHFFVQCLGNNNPCD